MVDDDGRCCVPKSVIKRLSSLLIYGHVIFLDYILRFLLPHPPVVVFLCLYYKFAAKAFVGLFGCGLKCLAGLKATKNAAFVK